MKDVSVIWYRIYYWWIVCLSFIVGIALISAHYVSPIHKLKAEFALNPSAIILVVMCLFFCAVVYKKLKANNRTFAVLLPTLFFWLILLYGIQNSGARESLVYIASLLITIGFSGLYGTQALLATSFATVTYVLVISNFQLYGTDSEKYILVVGTVVITFISWWVWGRLSVHYSAKMGSRLSIQLETSEEKSEIIIQSISDGVIVFDKTGKITLINSAASILTEWKMEDAIGMDAQLVLKVSNEDGSPLNVNDDLLSIANNKKENVTQTVVVNGHVSKQTIVSLVISPLLVPPNNEAEGAVAVIRDITKAKQEERQRSDFISTASHEMRSPVAAIEGYLALALNPQLSTIDTKARDYLEKAHESTRHLGQLFQDLLTSAKAEDGRLTSHPTVVEVGSFLERLSENLRLVAQKKQLSLKFKSGAESDVIDATETGGNKHSVRPLYYVNADPDRLQEVITNLFDNAIKFTESGGIVIGLTGNNDTVQLYVSDTGQGIPADDIKHLFQKFYRVDNAETRSIGGTGLGLFICAKIIELYHGHIRVESKLGEGSTFYINLPRLDTARARQLQTSEPFVINNTDTTTLAS
jgi:PAS domain S-box-containing protein